MKKQKERSIFDAVYAGRPILSVTPSEEPDFRVTNAACEFGVEITKFYFSEPEARLKNIPTYFREILDKKEYRHKDDIVPLEVKEFTVLPRDNRRPSFTVAGLLRERPKIDEYVKKIVELIEQKNKRFPSYIAGLTHVNLIVSDEEQRLLGAPKDMFHHFFYLPELEKVLMQTDFTEIYFITQLGKPDVDKKVYVPLKMLFLLAELFTFNNVLSKAYPDTEMTGLLSAEYLTWRGAKNVSFQDTSDSFEVAFGNSGVQITQNGAVDIKDYCDFPVPRDFIPVSAHDVSSFWNSTFLSVFEEHKRENVFASPLCFAVGEVNS